MSQQLLENLVGTYIPDGGELHREIARLSREVAQLQTTVALLVELNPDIALPEKCRKRDCDYFRHYLMYGGPELNHFQYHKAVEVFDAHLVECRKNKSNTICRTCVSHEQVCRS